VLLLAAHAAEALGPDVVRVVTGDRHTGRLLTGADVDAIAFTGSERGGLEVAAAAGIRRLSLELGGNCPALVLPDAPEHTWAALTAASTYNAGQSCAAPARVTTLASCYDDVVKALGAAVGELAAARDFGPLNNPDQLARYDRLVGGAGGAQVQRGGIVPAAGEEAGYWRPACVVADVPGDDPVVIEEVFGPVLTVESVPSLEEALARANRMPQALAASVWSTDVARALTVARHLDAGEVWVNCHLVQTAELPHGGRRASGTGTDLSVLALGEYQRPKTITAYLGS
jgi:betaine-aldehyde dehydrogenase